ncbi:OmpA family protein [candidate division KSB1 bacterium]|nr:OmpA family protein [candidate division KSB1 bacterium]
MRIALTIMIILFLLLIGAGFYYFYFNVMPMKAELNRLKAENVALLKLKEENAALLQEKSQLIQEKQAKEKEVTVVTQTYQNLLTDLKEEIKDGQIKISELSGKLMVNIVDKILFDSGDATIGEKGKKILARLGKIIKADTSKIFRVEGHTDNVKIHKRLQKNFPTNWELSTSRATNVVRFLQDEMKIDGNRLEAVGYGEFKPVASNKTETGRAQNRRIEIILLPR